MQKHVETVSVAVKEAEEATSISDNDDEEEDDKDENENEQWSGVEGPEAINHEDDYLDEDRHTVVTVEAVDVSRDGLHKKQDDPFEEDNDPTARSRLSAQPGRVVNGKKDKRAQSKGVLDQPSKKRKKKFRYESKAERKVTRFKERCGGKAKAKAKRA